MFTVVLVKSVNSKQKAFSFQRGAVFYGFATCWQSDGYKIQVELWGIITLRNTAICVKSAYILHHFMVWSDANSSVTCVKSQCIMNEIAHKELWKSKTTPVFSSVFLCLVVFWSVKNEQGIQQKIIIRKAFPSPFCRLVSSFGWFSSLGFCGLLLLSYLCESKTTFT